MNIKTQHASSVQHTTEEQKKLNKYKNALFFTKKKNLLCNTLRVLNPTKQHLLSRALSNIVMMMLDGLFCALHFLQDGFSKTIRTSCAL